MDSINEKINFFKQLLTDQSWQAVQTINSIKVEKKMIPNSDIACFKSSGIVNAKADDLIKYVWNIYNTKENVQVFDTDITEYNIVCKLDSQTRICRQVNKLPWPMWPRESVYIQYVGSEANQSYIIMFSVECEEVPVQTDKFVRSNINISAYIFEPCESCTMIHRIAHIEPCGNIPSSLINGYATKTAGVIQHLMSIYN